MLFNFPEVLRFDCRVLPGFPVLDLCDPIVRAPSCVYSENNGGTLVFMQWCSIFKIFVVPFISSIFEFFQFSGFDLVGPVFDVFLIVQIFKFSLVLFTIDFRHLRLPQYTR